MPRRRQRKVVLRTLRADPAEGRKMLAQALRRSQGNVMRAARILSIGWRTLRRKLVQYALEDELEAIRQESGWNRPEVRGGVRFAQWCAKRRRAAKLAEKASKDATLRE